MMIMNTIIIIIITIIIAYNFVFSSVSPNEVIRRGTNSSPSQSNYIFSIGVVVVIVVVVVVSLVLRDYANLLALQVFLVDILQVSP